MTPPRERPAPPTFHRSFLYIGLSLLCVWLALLVITGVVKHYQPMVYDTFSLITILVFILGVVCTTLSVICEITCNLSCWSEIRRTEEQLLCDLSGRSRFDRIKKKHKRVRVGEEEPAPR